MSRCFPFPPPGYERKTKADDPELLKKEKHREKKDKKEKRDKEKKEGKEKREKEKSDEKRREKKEKKEKHRDKKKDKEKDRDKEKHKSNSVFPDEKKAVGPPEGHVPKPSEKSKDRESDRSAATLAEKRASGHLPFHNGKQVTRNNHLAPEPKNPFFSPEPKNPFLSPEPKDPFLSPEPKNPFLSPEPKTFHLVPETKGFKNAPELGRKSTDEGSKPISQLPDRNAGTQRIKDDGVVKMAGKTARAMVDGKEQKKEKAAVDGRKDGVGVVGETRSAGGASVPNSVAMVQSRVGEMAASMEKKIDQRVEGREKIREKEGHDRKGEKRKERDREKEKSIHKEKDREKEKKKEEKVKVTTEQKVVEQSRTKDGSENHMPKSSLKDGSKKDFPRVPSIGLQNTPKDNNQGALALNNPGKRKDTGQNGIYDEQNPGPNKLARTTASTHSLTENGMMSLEPCQKSAAFAPGTQRPPMNIKVDRTFAPGDTQRPPMNIKVDRASDPDATQRPPMNIKVDGKERKVNGVIAQTATKTERKADALVKQPHPDTKYLSQVLSVPKMDDNWSDFDDQEWLFNSSSSQLRKPELEPSVFVETRQVWAKALWLEPVDVHALPYVIPY